MVLRSDRRKTPELLHSKPNPSSPKGCCSWEIQRWSHPLHGLQLSNGPYLHNFPIPEFIACYCPTQHITPAVVGSWSCAFSRPDTSAEYPSTCAQYPSTCTQYPDSQCTCAWSRTSGMSDEGSLIWSCHFFSTHLLAHLLSRIVSMHMLSLVFLGVQQFIDIINIFARRYPGLLGAYTRIHMYSMTCFLPFFPPFYPSIQPSIYQRICPHYILYIYELHMMCIHPPVFSFSNVFILH